MKKNTCNTDFKFVIISEKTIISELSLKNINLINSLGTTFIFIIFFSFTSVFYAQPPVQHTENNKDQVLHGNGRINSSTLAMEMEIPLGNYPGRGISVPISLNYTSKLWRMDPVTIEENTNGTCFTVNRAVYSENAASGWTTSVETPYIEYTGWNNRFTMTGFPQLTNLCSEDIYHSMVKRLTVHLPGGQTHELREDDSILAYNFSSIPSRNGTYYAVDGSNIKYVEDSSNGTYRLLMPDGSFYDFESNTAALTVPRKAVKFFDRNGNFISYNNQTGVITDTLGNVFSAPFGILAPAEPVAQTYQLPGMTGTYKFLWKKLKGNSGSANDSALTDPNQPLKYKGDMYISSNGYQYRSSDEALFASNYNKKLRVDDGGIIFNPVVLTEIELPTGQRYRFNYDIYGRIEQIYYPTGGRETFTYQQIVPLTPSDPDNVSDQTNFGVIARKVYESQNAVPYQWNYGVNYTAPQGYKVSTINPDGTRIERFLHRGATPPITPQNGTFGYDGYDEGLTGMPYETRGFDDAGNLISRNLTHWTTTAFDVYASNSVTDVKAHWHPRVTSEENYIYTAAGDGVKAATKYEYKDENNLARESPLLRKRIFEYGFVAVFDGGGITADENPDPNPTPVPTPAPPTLLRTTETTFLIDDPNYAATRSYYAARNMTGLATISVVKDNAGTIVSRSETSYDENGYPLIQAGVTTGWQDPQTIYRGNPTGSKVWDSTKGAVTNAAAYISTRAQFDNFGNRRRAWDARGNMTQTDYASPAGQDYKFAFPTKVTSAVPDPSGQSGSQTAFITTATFNPVNGLPLTATDANGLETRIERDPVTLRPIRTKNYYNNQQVGATSETIYHDEPNNYWIKSRTQIDTNKWAESILYFDGLGRNYKSEEVNSEGNIFVEKEFDAEGRVRRVTNPFRANEAKIWTTNVYDEASRVKEVILPDNAKVKTDYGVSTSGLIGVTKQITDPAGKKRKGVTDALGRMIRVIEDPDNLSFSTDYVFDTLGNLRKTTQGEQSRYFSYDSLGRLLYAKQPEQEANTNFVFTDPITNNSAWSVRYQYDDASNIISTTDARGVSVTGSYDNFNRLKTRDYSDATPDVSFYYDGAGLPVVPAFSKGKTTKVSSSVSENRYTSFDNLGRLLAHEQITDGRTYQTGYQYNLTSLVSETYPSGKTVFYNADADGELESVWGQKPNNAARLYLNQIKYNSAGLIEKMRLGNSRWETAVYSSRGLVTEIGLGHSDTDKSLLHLENFYGAVTENNGSLRRQKIDYRGLANSITQDYAYDDLNRLKSSTETVAGSATPVWKQTFNYDRYGNRVFDAPNTTTLSRTASWKIVNPSINTSDNRLKKDQDGDNVADYIYDKAGNVTLDAENQRFVFDADSRMKEFFHSTNASNAPDAVYGYDGEGRRVMKKSGNRTVIFVYNSSGQLIAEYDSQPAENPQISYLTADHLGSPRVITNGRGAVIARHDYMAYGTDITETLGSVGGRTTAHGYNSADEVRKQYTGYERDDESGLDFAQARHYNSSHGRFTSVDPLTASASIRDPQTFNRYSYALNSPYKFTDPLGLLAVGAAPNTSRMGYGSGGGAFSGALSAWKGTFAQTEGAGPRAEQPQDPPAASDGTVAASDIAVNVPAYDRHSTTDGRTALFDETLTANATAVATTVAQTDIAYQKNRANWEKQTKEFNDAVDASSSFEARDMADWGSGRDIGTVNMDCTISGVPEQASLGSMTLSLVFWEWQGNEITITNSAGVASANKASEQIRLLNRMQDPDSVQRRDFIQANLNTTVTFKENGKISTRYLGARDAGVVFDAAIQRGFAASAIYQIKK